MSPDEAARRAESLFVEVLELPPEDREGFLDEASTGDPETGSRVREMLRALDEADRYLLGLGSRLAAGRADAGEASPEAAVAPPAQVGPFRLVRLIGRGGMGAVYLGERDGDFRQRVAVKLLPAWARSEVFVGRFASERRILARLEHPGIARLIDGGLLGDGTPYLVMEYVAGLPLDRHADERRLGVAARLRLFRELCEAVQFAHGRLVVHRDLKPSNILVTPEGRAKLLDFGIAKALEGDDAGEATFLTRAGGRPMTPAFAAPEQVRGERVGTGADVYSLGALLYLLLAGRPPLDVAGLAAGELERRVSEEAPLPPSRAVDAEAAARRGTSLARLRRRLAGDLDTVVLKALRKEPERRYASAAQLAEDVERVLEGLPVAARPDTRLYRARKFVGRHPWGVAASVALPLAAVSALWIHAERLEAERDLARREAATAAQVSAFLEELFESAGPERTMGEDMPIGAVLDAGTERIAELEGEPLVQARLMSSLARVHRSLGRYEPARELAAGALALREAHLGAGHPDAVRSGAQLGVLLQQLGDFEEAETVLAEAVARGREAVGSGTAGGGVGGGGRGGPGAGAAEALAEALHNLGSVLHVRGDLEGAEAAFTEALEIRRARFGPASLEAASTLNQLGLVAHTRARYGEAEALWEEVAAIRREALGADHPETLPTLANLASARTAAGDWRGAEAAHREVLDARRRVLGPDHPDVAATLHQIGLVHWSEEDLDRAEEAWVEAVAVYRRALGDEHPNVARSLTGLAGVARGRGDLEEAERILEEVLRVYRVHYGEEHPNVANMLNNLGAVRFERGDVEGGRALYRRSLELRRAALGEDHPDVAHVLHNLGQSYVDTGQLDEAEPLLVEALTIREAALGADHPASEATRTELAELRAARGDGG